MDPIRGSSAVRDMTSGMGRADGKSASDHPPPRPDASRTPFFACFSLNTTDQIDGISRVLLSIKDLNNLEDAYIALALTKEERWRSRTRGTYVAQRTAVPSQCPTVDDGEMNEEKEMISSALMMGFGPMRRLFPTSPGQTTAGILDPPPPPLLVHPASP